MSAVAEDVENEIAEEEREQTLKEKLKHYLPNLENLCTLKMAAADAFNDAAKKVALDTGIDKTVLTQFVNARMRNKETQFADRMEQMDLLITETADEDE